MGGRNTVNTVNWHVFYAFIEQKLHNCEAFRRETFCSIFVT